MTDTICRRIDACTTEEACARIFERHRDQIAVRNPAIAIANLVRIIEAVLQSSARKGFHETSLRDLARASGLSMGGLYSYFDGKEQLLTMILTEVAETVQLVLNDIPEDIERDPRTHLRSLIATHISVTELMHSWFVFAYMEAKGFPDGARRLAIESELATESIFAKALERGVEKGVFDVENVDLTAALIKPLLQDWYVKRAKYRKRGIGIQAYTLSVTKFVERAILFA